VFVVIALVIATTGVTMIVSAVRDAVRDERRQHAAVRPRPSIADEAEGWLRRRHRDESAST
jgi:hypothetical protein